MIINLHEVDSWEKTYFLECDKFNMVTMQDEAESLLISTYPIHYFGYKLIE